MKIRNKLMLAISLWPLLSHCSVVSKVDAQSSQKPPRIIISELVFINQSNVVTEQVTLRVKKNGNIVSCGYIGPGSECATGFPLRTYQDNPITVQWQSSGKQVLHEDIRLENRTQPDLNGTARVIIYLLDSDQIKAQLVSI